MRENDLATPVPISTSAVQFQHAVTLHLNTVSLFIYLFDLYPAYLVYSTTLGGFQYRIKQ